MSASAIRIAQDNLNLCLRGRTQSVHHFMCSAGDSEESSNMAHSGAGARAKRIERLRVVHRVNNNFNLKYL